MKKLFYTCVLVTSSFLFLFNSNQEEPIVLNFAFGPDDAHTIAPLINQFNYEHEGKIKINWVEGSRASDEFYKTVKEDLLSEQPTIDVFGADVTWTASLAKEEVVKDLSTSFHELYSTRDFIPAAMNSAVYQSKVLGIPWFTDVGMLYYRKDLLDKYGFDPPTTWEELTTIVRTIQPKESIPYGLVFQGDNYEGGIANACEFIWNAGGDISMSNLSVAGAFEDMYFDPSIITVDSKASEIGFGQARQLIENGIAPSHIHTFREEEALYSFYYGGAIFMRGWPSVHGLFSKPDTKLGLDKVGVCSIPTLRPTTSSLSCLGGWNLMMAKHLNTEEQQAAWKFMKYLTAEPQQYYRAVAGGSLPTLQHLYYDEQLLSEAPILDIGAGLIQHARNRPISPYYMEYAPEIAYIFHQVLKGEIIPEMAVFELQQRLENIQTKNQIAFK